MGGVRRIEGPGAFAVLKMLLQISILCVKVEFLTCPNKICSPIRSCVLVGPLRAVNRLRPLIKLAVVMVSRTSICTALVLKQVNMAAHRLFSAWPPFVLREVMAHGPKTSTPTCVKGGSTDSLSAGKPDIFCSSSLPLSRLQVTHLCITEDTSFSPQLATVQLISRHLLLNDVPDVQLQHDNVSPTMWRCETLK